MISLLRQLWWKLLSIPILLFAIFSGLMIPLGPGIQQISEVKIQPGKTYTLAITGYNTHFQEEANSTKVWLKKGSTFVCAEDLKIFSDLRLSAVFKIPASIGNSGTSKFVDLVINNNVDGTVALREALIIINDTTLGTSPQPDEICQVKVDTDKAAFLNFPNREIIKESIRNLFFHVPMWFAMIFMLVFSLFNSILFLMKGNMKFDLYAAQSTHVALVFGVLGLATGMLWAKFTWGHPWPNDPRLNGTAIAMLIYFAYLILRGSLPDDIKRAKISSVYNIFAFVIYIIFIFVIPNLGDSLHPGRGENPAFSKYDLDNSMRLVFYPAIIGWTLLGFWIISIKIRFTFAADKVKLMNGIKQSL